MSIGNSSAKLTSPPCSTLPAVLDACCGGRAMWFTREDGRALFMDRREEVHVIDRGDQAAQHVAIAPDMLADFTDMPFPDESFHHVVFDPPHCNRASATGYTAKKYGVLLPGWEEMLRAGFEECFRVLKPNGTLIFKWCEHEIPLREILALTPHKPLYGHRTGSREKTHWVAFLKSQREAAETADEKPDGQAENDQSQATKPAPDGSR